MTNGPLDLINKRIADIEKELITYKEARAELERASGMEPTDEYPSLQRLDYVNMAPIEAVEKLLDRSREPMRPQDIVKELSAGGATLNKKRGENNIRIAIENSIVNNR